MNPTEKAIVLSYLLSKLLNRNLDVVLHEMKVIGDEDAGKMQHRVEKLIGANRNVFRILERNISNSENIDQLEEDLDKLLEKIWE
jgi:uncharacterized protein (DUF2267 family)